MATHTIRIRLNNIPHLTDEVYDFTNFEIINIHQQKLLFRYNRKDKVIYQLEHIYQHAHPSLILEIINNSPLWELNYEFIKVSMTLYVNILINMDKTMINEYGNKSVAFTTILSSIFDKLPIYSKTDFTTKSFVSYEELSQKDNMKITAPNFNMVLYDYQKNSLARMLKIERSENVINFIKYTKSITFCDEEYIYNPITNQRVMDDKYLNITIKGGVLSDEMGLGKTITSIALITANPAPKDSPKIKFSPTYKMNKLFTKATLVLCPAHLTKQWKTEVEKCNPKFNILTIVAKKDMEKISIANIIDADIIITSHQFLMNFKYYPTLYYAPCTASNYSFSSRETLLKSKLIKILEDPTTLNGPPVFEFFFFQRIILDEGHEIFGQMLGSGAVSMYMATWLKTMDANYYWYVSGTPFINFVGVKNASDYLKLTLHEPEKNIDMADTYFPFLMSEYIWENIIEKICIRHRKVDVENQIKIPGYEEKLIWVKFTELEKQLYDSKIGKVPRGYLQQLCCHPLVLDANKRIFGNVEVDLLLMQDKLISYHKINHDFYKKKLEGLDTKKPEYYMLKKVYENNIHESYYLYTILEQMKNKPIEDDTSCSICMDTLDNPTLTACGHLFCYDCLKMCLSEKNKCPMCKADLSGKDLLVTTKKVDKIDVNPLIAKYGSKLGKTISIIRTLVAQPSSRIIIFSQWDDMLNLIGKTLSENGIENCFVKGNVWSRNSAISKFKAGKNSEGQDNKVIMLSLKNAASGTNLTEATHILFIEPIDASIEECKAIEGQAIGRACRINQKNKIIVMRILIENTIEEEIYKKTYNKNVIVKFTPEETLVDELFIKPPNVMEI